MDKQLIDKGYENVIVGIAGDAIRAVMAGGNKGHVYKEAMRQIMQAREASVLLGYEYEKTIESPEGETDTEWMMRVGAIMPGRERTYAETDSEWRKRCRGARRRRTDEGASASSGRGD